MGVIIYLITHIFALIFYLFLLSSMFRNFIVEFAMKGNNLPLCVWNSGSNDFLGFICCHVPHFFHYKQEGVELGWQLNTILIKVSSLEERKKERSVERMAKADSNASSMAMNLTVLMLSFLLVVSLAESRFLGNRYRICLFVA